MAVYLAVVAELPMVLMVLEVLKLLVVVVVLALPQLTVLAVAEEDIGIITTLHTGAVAEATVITVVAVEAVLPVEVAVLDTSTPRPSQSAARPIRTPPSRAAVQAATQQDL